LANGALCSPSERAVCAFVPALSIPREPQGFDCGGLSCHATLDGSAWAGPGGGLLPVSRASRRRSQMLQCRRVAASGGEWRRRPLNSAARGAIAQLGERLLCKQEVTGSIPVGSTRGMPANTGYSARWLVRQRSGPGSDGSAMEAFRPTLLLCGSGGGAAGLTRPARRSGGEARAESYASPPPKSNPWAPDDFAIVTAITAAGGPDDQAPGQVSQSARAACAGRASALLDVSVRVARKGEAGGDEAAAKAPRQVKHDRGWSESPMSNTNRSRPRRQQLPSTTALPQQGGRSSPHPQPEPSGRQTGTQAMKDGQAMKVGKAMTVGDSTQLVWDTRSVESAATPPTRPSAVGSGGSRSATSRPEP
jgi:hypothetical protein